MQSGGIAPIERFECLPILRCYTPDQVEVVVFGETRGDLLDRDRAFGDLDASAAPSGCARRGVPTRGIDRNRRQENVMETADSRNREVALNLPRSPGD